MLKYLFLCFSLLVPAKVSAGGNFGKFYPKNTQIICMAPPPGNSYSKVSESTRLPKEGCETNSETIYHSNGDTTENISITFTKEIKRDRHGNVIRESDTSRGGFSSANKSFFKSEKKSGGGSSSGSKRR